MTPVTALPNYAFSFLVIAVIYGVCMLASRGGWSKPISVLGAIASGMFGAVIYWIASLAEHFPGEVPMPARHSLNMVLLALALVLIPVVAAASDGRLARFLRHFR